MFGGRAGRAGVATVQPLCHQRAVPQPAMLVPPSVKFTVPVGALPVTDAVNVTFAPTIDGLEPLVTPVVVATFALMTCDSDTLLDAVFDTSPA